MSTFDSSRYDVPTLVEKLRDQRFDGYDAASLAAEVEKFRAGGGTAAMGDAVDALKRIAAALSETDTTLREQLGALGVSWQSKAGGQASTVLAGQAGFSADANTKVAEAAQLIFEQGEAFNRTKNKLPDPEALRQGDGHFTMADSFFSLFGFETDHAASVRQGLEAKAQAIDALNAYAHDSGNYLAASQPVEDPQSMDLHTSLGGGVESVAGPNLTQVPPVSSVPDADPTIAAGAKDAPVRNAPAHHAPVAAAAPPPAAASAPTPPLGIPAAHRSAAVVTPPSQVTTPSSTSPAARAPITEPLPNVVGHQRSAQQSQQQQESFARPGSATALPPSATGVPGSTAEQPQTRAGDRTAGAPAGGDRTAGSPGRPGAVEGTARGPAAGGEAVLGKGKVFGSVPGGASGGVNVGPGLANVRAAGGVSALAEGAPAIGAAGAAGATSGERERDRRPGRNQAGKRVRQLPVGDLPEEEEALLARKAAPEPPSAEHTRSILEPAATQDGDEDALHVRRYGVDDRDLFSDPREVSTDLIGGKPLPEE
ncbi:hypothetical protein [Amycolatopsis sacchari]|uniref:PPE family protein n=1 Tax=Amycolatopsis sacchari TaxID=115433 RepID=A0A1I3TU72_9PSEU|nr:hypothetical protein [Amycolatopsis sacchari]SFJ73176.1 hypothetical protein SAMN05421835_10819 [Amycolatopsis sacchari]